MSLSAPAPGGPYRQALIVGVGCYVLWGAMPALFIVMGHAGATPLEILAERAAWSAPWALALVLIAGQSGQVARVFARPRLLAMLALSALLIGSGWAVYVWAVTNGRNLESSLGYYITPLLNMAAGALVFRERIDKVGAAAIALASVGVILQTLALGHPPVIALFLAVAFWGYGLIRKRIDADAQTGLFVECLLMAGPGLAYVIWLHHAGGGIFGRSLGHSLLMAFAGPATVAPLALFAWTVRRLPLSVMGFLQFIAPTIGFAVGIANGETLTPLTAVSFVFIWGGAATFIFGAWRATRALSATVGMGVAAGKRSDV
ncbi:MAG: EamA family transporter RarD [Pseudomonadota bacterium]|nr:EamA family transporter RarD [Pseudomonadota bacterium]